MSGPNQSNGNINEPSPAPPANNGDGPNESGGEKRPSRRKRYKDIASSLLSCGPIVIVRRKASRAYRWSVSLILDPGKGLVLGTWVLVCVAIGALWDSEAATEKAQRAWVGPNGMSSTGAPVAEQDLETTLAYINSGKEPATAFVQMFAISAITQKSFDDGTAFKDINKTAKACMKFNYVVEGQAAFPSFAASGYSQKISVSKSFIDSDVVAGQKIIFVNGCFVYRTFGKLRHSAFCYYYAVGKTQPQNWNICTAGHDAD